MNKKLRLSIFLMLGVLIFVFVLAGCEKVPGIKATYVSTQFSNGAVEGESRLVKERSELLSFVNQEQTDLSKLAKYDDNFFKSNSLVIFKIVEENQDNKSEIASYTIENDTITINVETTKQGKDGTSTHYYFILEMKKNSGDSITKIKVLKNGELLLNKFTEEEYNNYVMQFDLTEEKHYSAYTVDSSFYNDKILIVMRRTSTYPEFKLEYLGLSEAVSFEYLVGPRPGEHNNLNVFRQIVAVKLIPQTKERIIEIVKRIEKLDFVRSADPNGKLELQICT